MIRIMSGGLMGLIAYGAQDIYLSVNPNITFYHNEPVVEIFKEEKFDNFQKNDKYNQCECVICLDKFNVTDLVIVRKCEHIYHKNCDYVQLISCPICRQ